jgi:hypothetical protein
MKKTKQEDIKLKILRCPAMKIKNNRSKEKARKEIFSSESAAATVIAAVLLLSIIFALFAVVRIAYVPEWKTDAEQSHMSEVQRDMVELKSTADMIALLQSLNLNSSPEEFPVTVPVSMGGGEIPILEPSKASGALSVNTEPCNITINRNSSNSSFPPIIADCGGITYRSNNRQYVDQVFRYENGALILKQGNRSVMKQSPLFSIQQTDGKYNFSIRAIKVKGKSDTISSDTYASLLLTGLKPEITSNSRDLGKIDNFTCTILTEYPDAWFSYFNGIAENAGLECGTDYILKKTNETDPNNVSYYKVSFSFPHTGSKNIENLNISESVIRTELGI